MSVSSSHGASSPDQKLSGEVGAKSAGITVSSGVRSWNSSRTAASARNRWRSASSESGAPGPGPPRAVAADANSTRWSSMRAEVRTSPGASAASLSSTVSSPESSVERLGREEAAGSGHRRLGPDPPAIELGAGAAYGGVVELWRVGRGRGQVGVAVGQGQHLVGRDGVLELRQPGAPRLGGDVGRVVRRRGLLVTGLDDVGRRACRRRGRATRTPRPRRRPVAAPCRRGCGAGCPRRVGPRRPAPPGRPARSPAAGRRPCRSRRGR